MKIITDKENVRLDKYLASKLDYSREMITKMIESGQVLVEGKVKKAGFKITLGLEIEVPDTFFEKQDIKPVKMDLDIVYEDDDIIVINKPSGLVVHPGSGNSDNTLVNGLLEYTSSLSSINGSDRVGIVHRIDKDTSGLMMVAKTNKAHSILAERFKNHDIKREYVALLCGELPYNSATIDAPIKRDSKNFNKMGVFESGKKAITHLKVLKRYKGYTLVKLNLETGRTHQIRVHMNYIGFPIFNDPVYNKNESNSFGQFLHSRSIDFEHPISKEKMHFEVDVPKEFQDFLDTL